VQPDHACGKPSMLQAKHTQQAAHLAGAQHRTEAQHARSNITGNISHAQGLGPGPAARAETRTGAADGAKKRGAHRATGPGIQQAAYASREARHMRMPQTQQVHDIVLRHNMRATTTPGTFHTRRRSWIDAVIILDPFARAKHFIPSQKFVWEGRSFIG